PPLALANGMWIGDVPLELKMLTLPERVLIARHFPAAYIVKLYPKKKGARHWPAANMQSGLPGNVSTYHLNTNNIAHMVAPDVMPQDVGILPATIGITFIGPNNLPQKTMPGFLCVNRNRVSMALRWLKANNTLYHNISISSSRLDKLPANGIPEELLAITRHSSNEILLSEENDNYVPEHATDSENDGTSSPF
ncbi:hypothetical protein EI94DRAFT_1600947, partial [Lactarius quietus]